VRWTGQIVVMLTRERIKGLKLSVPLEYTRLTQITFAEGTGYPEPADFSYFDVGVMNDSKIKTHIQQRMLAIRKEGHFTPMAVLQQQLQRKHCTLDLPEPSGKTMTPAEIYRQQKSAVVAMVKMNAMGRLSIASGVIIGPTGIVVTNYHVLGEDPETTTLLCATLSDARVFPVREVLAADRATDVAIVRISADRLTTAALSSGEPIGAPVTIISHPSQRFWYLSHGMICRYGRAFHAGEERVYMEVSAEFMPGSSGGPAFAADGSVAGIVSTIETNQGAVFVFRQCIPVQSIRQLIRAPSESHAAKHRKGVPAARPPE
jgi:S1-C subfamily serine protease